MKRFTVFGYSLATVTLVIVLTFPFVVNGQTAAEEKRVLLIKIIELLTAQIEALYREPELAADSRDRELPELTAIASASMLGLEHPDVSPRPADIVVVMGQSNAVGRGDGGYEEIGKLTSEGNRVYQVTRDDHDDMKVALVTQEPLAFWGQNNSQTNKKGLAYPFALRLARSLPPERDVIIVPAAKGATSVLLWDWRLESFVTNSGERDSRTLYTDMVKRIQFALDTHPDNRIAAVIWQAGEADITAIGNKHSPLHDYMSPNRFMTALKSIRTSLRRRFDDQGCFPILIGEPSREWEPVNGSVAGLEAKRDVIKKMREFSKNDPCDATVFVPSHRASSNGLGDEIHFSAEGQYEMARNYWGRYSKLR